MSERRVINLDEVAVQENGNGQSFSAKIGRISPMLGSIGLGCTLTILPPGKRAFPFHRHHVTDEKFYIIDGSGELRLDDKVVPIRAGDLIANPAGKEAHQIVDNRRWRGHQGRRHSDGHHPCGRRAHAHRLFRWRGTAKGLTAYSAHGS